MKPRYGMLLYVLSISGLLMLISACSGLGQERTIRITAEVPTEIPPPVNTPEFDLTLEPFDDAIVSEEASIDLILWLAPDIQLDEGAPGGPVLQAQVDQFLANNPNINLDIEYKTTVGQGGMTNYFQTARTIAPSILPDLILVPSYQIEEFIGLEAGVAIDAYISPEIAGDFFPAAAEMGQIDGVWFGYPYVVTELTHVAFNPTVISDTIPTRWSDFNSSEARILYPAGGSLGARILLEMYSAEGGSIYDEEGALAIDGDALTRALQLIQTARQRELVLQNSSSTSSEQDSWFAFEQGDADLIFTSTEGYMRQRQLTEELQFGPVPGLSGSAPSQLEGWVWLISTADPVRQAAAGELMLWLSSGENLSEWSNASNQVPLSRSGLAGWPDTAYSDFVMQEMERAFALDRGARGVVLDSFETALRILFSTEDPDVLEIAEQIVDQTN